MKLICVFIFNLSYRVHNFPFTTHAKFSAIISNPLIHTGTCAYTRVRTIVFRKGLRTTY